MTLRRISSLPPAIRMPGQDGDSWFVRGQRPCSSALSPYDSKAAIARSDIYVELGRPQDALTAIAEASRSSEAPALVHNKHGELLVFALYCELLERSTTMATFVLLSRLSPELMENTRGRRAVGKEWLQKVSKHCPDVEWQHHYALLGHYDFMDIFEAPGFETAHKVAYISRHEGALEVETWEALPYDRYLEIVDEIG